MSFFYLPLYSLISLTMVKTLQISKHLYDNFSRPSWFVQRSCCSLLEVIYFLQIEYKNLMMSIMNNFYCVLSGIIILPLHISNAISLIFRKYIQKGYLCGLLNKINIQQKFSSAVKCLGGFNRGSIFSFYNLHLLYASGETCLLLEPIIFKRGKRNTR